MIKFVVEYTDGMFNYLVLQTGTEGKEGMSCGWETGCDRQPDCSMFDAEGSDPIPFCLLHATMLDESGEEFATDWRKTQNLRPNEIVANWIIANPTLFVRSVWSDAKGRDPEHIDYDPEQVYHH